ncbi:MAG: hypothetical protein UZ21_OP11001001063 [Microgenomates bacterium OLB22]|nr:MAG: hypothetical protein UZ21_OP11001001063 [Microgenomates bacterium OLB22]
MTWVGSAGRKNTIVQIAKYENICIIHDRVAFEKDWYKSMKRWGNSFEHLACLQFYEGNRTNDWLLHEKIEGIEYSFSSHLDPRDWDINACQGGQMHIVKKSMVLACPWDESYMWGRPEDVKLTNDLRDRGHIIRCNPDAHMRTLIYKFGELPGVSYNPKKLSSHRTGRLSRIVARKAYRILAHSKWLQKLVLSTTQRITQNGFLK